MAAEDLKLRWGSLTALTVTNLHSLADQNIWQSGKVTDTSPCHEILEISYHLITNAAFTEGEHVAVRIARGNGDGTPIWDGGIGESEGQITAAAAKAEVRMAMYPVKYHHWVTSHGTAYKGVVRVRDFGPDWQVLIEPVGEALAAAGNIVKYRYGTFQRQTS